MVQTIKVGDSKMLKNKHLVLLLLSVVLFLAHCNKKVTTVPAGPQENSALTVIAQQPVPSEEPQPSSVSSSEEKLPGGATEKPAPVAAVWPFPDSGVIPFEIVYFDYDKFDLRPEAKTKLAQVALLLKKFPEKKIIIEGHCDERGTIEYNLALGERRAYSVKTYLTNSGIPAERMETISYGKEKPVDLGHNEEAWAKNRRAAIITKN